MSSEVCQASLYPSPVPLRLMKAPKRDTLSPRERAIHLINAVPSVESFLLKLAPERYYSSLEFHSQRGFY